MQEDNYTTRAQYVRTGNELNKSVDTSQFVEANRRKINFDKKLEELSIRNEIVLSGNVARQNLINEVGTVDKELHSSFVNDTEINDEDNTSTGEVRKKEKSEKEKLDENILAVQNKGKAIAESMKQDQDNGFTRNAMIRKVS